MRSFNLAAKEHINLQQSLILYAHPHYPAVKKPQKHLQKAFLKILLEETGAQK